MWGKASAIFKLVPRGLSVSSFYGRLGKRLSRLRYGQLSSGFGYALEASKVRHCMRY